MSFASDDHGVRGPSHPHSEPYGSGPIRLHQDFPPLTFRDVGNSRLHGIENRKGILRPWVVVRQHGDVSETCSSRSHQWSLACIAITAAAKNNQNTAFCDLSYREQ